MASVIDMYPYGVGDNYSGTWAAFTTNARCISHDPIKAEIYAC